MGVARATEFASRKVHHVIGRVVGVRTRVGQVAVVRADPGDRSAVLEHELDRKSVV